MQRAAPLSYDLHAVLTASSEASGHPAKYIAAACSFAACKPWPLACRAQLTIRLRSTDNQTESSLALQERTGQNSLGASQMSAERPSA